MPNKEKKDNDTSGRARFFSYLRIYAAANHFSLDTTKFRPSAKWDEAIQNHFHSNPRSMLKMMFRDYFHKIATNGLTNPKQFFLEHLAYIQIYIKNYPDDKADQLIRHGLKDAWDSLVRATKKSITSFLSSHDMQIFLLDFMHYEHEIDEEAHRTLYANLKKVIQNLANHSQCTIPQEGDFNYTFSFSPSRSNTHLIDTILSNAVSVSSTSNIKQGL